ncbi:MAG: TIGR02996 domain-containing protein [Myxococcota bacterium]
MTTPRHEALEAAIDAAPDDVERWLVYADWLMQQGHPRGEVIRLDVEASRQGDARQAAELEARADDIAAQLPLERALGSSRRRPSGTGAGAKSPWGSREATASAGEGVQEAEVDAGRSAAGIPSASLASAAAERSFGFITCARLGYRTPDFRPERPSDDIPRSAAPLERWAKWLSHADARFLHELTLQTPGPGEWARVLDLLRGCALPRLRRVFLYAREYAALPGGEVLPHPVRALRLEAGQLGAEPLRAPRLEVLDVDAAGFEPSLLDALAASTLPALATFRLSARYTPLAPRLRPLLSARWPGLRHLALHGLVLWPEDLRALARAGLLAGLSSLDLSSSVFPEPASDAVLTDLADVAAAARGLERLVVGNCQLPPASVDGLRSRLAGLVVSG